MKLRIALFVCFATSLTLAADKSCQSGRGGYKMPLADGFSIQVAPTDDGRCRIDLLPESGEAIYSAVGEESHIEFAATGRDVNGRHAFGAAAALLLLAGALGAGRLSVTWMGRQPDGSFIVSSGRRIEPGRPSRDRRSVRWGFPTRLARGRRGRRPHIFPGPWTH